MPFDFIGKRRNMGRPFHYSELELELGCRVVQRLQDLESFEPHTQSSDVIQPKLRILQLDYQQS